MPSRAGRTLAPSPRTTSLTSWTAWQPNADIPPCCAVTTWPELACAAMAASLTGGLVCGAVARALFVARPGMGHLGVAFLAASITPFSAGNGLILGGSGFEPGIGGVG
jgi:hypothetical protein